MLGHPDRDDDIAAWLKRHRDEYGKNSLEWRVVDLLLDTYRLHADTGTPLSGVPHEG
jgi:hypothetical protein